MYPLSLNSFICLVTFFEVCPTIGTITFHPSSVATALKALLIILLSVCTAFAPDPFLYSGKTFFASSESIIIAFVFLPMRFAKVLLPLAGGPKIIVASLFLRTGMSGATSLSSSQAKRFALSNNLAIAWSNPDTVSLPKLNFLFCHQASVLKFLLFDVKGIVKASSIAFTTAGCASIVTSSAPSSITFFKSCLNSTSSWKASLTGYSSLNCVSKISPWVFVPGPLIGSSKSLNCFGLAATSRPSSSTSILRPIVPRLSPLMLPR